jgi:hypothetical protein
MRMEMQEEGNEDEEIEEGNEKVDRYRGYRKWKELGQKIRMKMMRRGSERGALFSHPLSHYLFSLTSFPPSRFIPKAHDGQESELLLSLSHLSRSLFRYVRCARCTC